MTTTTTCADDPLLVNHHDACIYGRDLRLLEDTRAWLNDACLHYQFVCLMQEQERKNVLFLDPSVVFCFVHQLEDPEEFQQFASGYPDLKTCRKVFLPINDTLAHNHGLLSLQEARGVLGTHWSLLLILLPDATENTLHSPSTCRFIHFDSSMHSGNRVAAQTVAEQWSLFWQKYCSPNPTATIPEPRVQEAKTPQQTNGYDCGVHVLLAAQVLAEMNDSSLNSVEEELDERLGNKLRNNPRLCIELRKQIAEDIRRRAEDSKKV